MPQNPNQVLVGLNTANTPTSLKVDANGALIISQPGAGGGATLVQSVGTIATTGTFQAAMAINADRLPGGAIVNNGTAGMTVSFSAFGDAKTGNTVPIAAGGTLSLATVLGPNAYTGAVAITGTKSDTFVTVEVSNT